MIRANNNNPTRIKILFTQVGLPALYNSDFVEDMIVSYEFTIMVLRVF